MLAKLAQKTFDVLKWFWLTFFAGVIASLAAIFAGYFPKILTMFQESVHKSLFDPYLIFLCCIVIVLLLFITITAWWFKPRSDENETKKKDVEVHKQPIDANASTTINTTPVPKIHNLPSGTKCLGRAKEIERALRGLASFEPLISIEGMGGVGKTTLAIEIAHRCLFDSNSVLDRLFESVVWISTKDRPDQKLWMNEILDTIAYMLGYPMDIQIHPERKRREVNRLLSERRTLIILDNFETVEDSELENWIQNVPEPSKLLITTRYCHLVQHKIWHVSLEGLEKSEAETLLRQQAERLELQIQYGNSQHLIELTQGNPIAIEWVLGYIKEGSLSFEETIKHLNEANKTFTDLYDYLFAQFWKKVLTNDAKHALLVMPFFVNLYNKEALCAASGLNSDQFNIALRQLIQLSLLKVDQEDGKSGLRYNIHPLTRAFASKKMQNANKFEEQARGRWSKYYLGFAASNLLREKPKERYWNTLTICGPTPIDPEWLNLQNLLAWAEKEGQDEILVELVMLLAHYMDRRFHYLERIHYARKAAEAANRLGRKVDEALFRIDALGFTLLEADHIEEAEQEIRTGLQIAQEISKENTEGIDLIVMANCELAWVFLAQGDVAAAEALIESVIPRECNIITQSRFHMVAGDVAQGNKNFVKAIEHYKLGYGLEMQFVSEEDDDDWVAFTYRLGEAYLANGDIVQAETQFKKVLEFEQRDFINEIMYARYGQACVAQAKGEIDKARRLAEDTLNKLSSLSTSHRLIKQINDFLMSLEKV